jgi:F0F1-type ATP synthase assembly protein I
MMPRRRPRLTAALLLAAALIPGPSEADERRAVAQPAPARDSLLNGALIGAGVGFGAGFLGLAAFNAKETDSGPIWDAEAIGFYTTAGVLGAVVGAGIGALVDAVRPSRTHGPGRPVNLVPVFGRHRRGILLTIRR